MKLLNEKENQNWKKIKKLSELIINISKTNYWLNMSLMRKHQVIRLKLLDEK